MGRLHTYSFDKSFFKNIDSEHKAYWLGFIYADGYISKNTLGINIKDTDKEHLEKFKTHINSNHPIRTYRNIGYSDGFSARIFLIDKELIQDMQALGVTYNKSLTLTFPTLPNHLIPHFVRGYFDGDGSIFGFKSRGYTYPRINIVGTYSFITSLSKALPCPSNIARENRRTSDIHYLSLSGVKRCSLFYNWCYRDSQVYLDRKHNKFKEVLNLEDLSADCPISPLFKPLHM